MTIIELTISNEAPLSSQLKKITGDAWNASDYCMIAPEPLNAGKNKLFMHKATEQLFKIIN